MAFFELKKRIIEMRNCQNAMVYKIPCYIKTPFDGIIRIRFAGKGRLPTLSRFHSSPVRFSVSLYTRKTALSTHFLKFVNSVEKEMILSDFVC